MASGTGSEMRSLAGHLAAATCAFLVMVGEYDARQGWASWESLSCAHWLNWRCGVGMVAARDQVRVARALREFPLIRARFAEGRISYSKVRAITRVVHPAIEERLLDLANDSTAAQLEHACSQLRRAQDQTRADAQLEAGEDRAIACRSMRCYTDHDTGDLIAQLRVPAGADADAFMARINEQIVRVAPDGDVLEPLECRRLDALLGLTAGGADVDASLAAQPEVIIHLDAPTPRGPTADAPGRSAVFDPLDRWPIRTSRCSLLSAAHLEQIGCDAGFRTVVDHTLHRCDTDDTDVGQSGTDSPGPAAAVGWNPFDPPAITSLDLGRHHRVPNRALRRAVMQRDGGRCRFPGCSTRHRLHVHHITHWEHGGRTDRLNLLLLCPQHHRAVHKGGWTLTGNATHAHFARPDHRPVDPAPPPLHGRLATLIHANQRHGSDIATDGAGSQWLGDHIDWDCFFAAFNDGPQTVPLEPLRKE